MTQASKRTVSQILDGLDNGTIVHDIHKRGFVNKETKCTKCEFNWWECDCVESCKLFGHNECDCNLD